MGKCLPGADAPGASAAAAGRRAIRADRHRRRVNAVCLVVGAALAVTGLGIGRYWVGAAAAAPLALCWWVRPDPDPQRWQRGADGEIATAQILARLPRRFVVLHDRHYPGCAGNVDHVVIGPTGVWVVDSKLRRARLRLRRGRVWAGEHLVDPQPAARQAESLSRALRQPVGAIVAIHGVGLRRRGAQVDGVHLIPARRLCHLLRRHRRRRRRLAPPTVAALVARADRCLPP